nr:protein NRT1/ PTR FAMILY 5.5-like [Ipomoea batatas]
MNHKIGKWQFPTTILLLLPKAAKYATLAACKYAFKSTRLKLLAESSEFGSMIGPIYAMINTVMCCLFAALVETARRHHIDDDETMTIFWLIPQFYALINVDATFHESVKALFKTNSPPSMKKYAVHFTQFVWGIGEALSLVSVLACKKWFNNDVDQSRLDKYYWTLTALTALAFICYLLLVIRSLGLAFLSMSTPPVLSNFAGNCSRYEAQCVGPVQKALFFTSLVLMGVGLAGHAVSLDAFLRICGVAALALSNTEPWDIKFAVPAIFSFTATLVFFAGKQLGFYSNYGDKPEGSALTTVLRVLVAATYKSCHKLPANSDHLYQGNHNSAKQLPHTDSCRCLDKAAIVLPRKRVDKEGENRWKVCNVTEVEETKVTVLTTTLWAPIIICGLVSSIGNTFFVVQAAKMNHNIGKWQPPSTILLLLSNSAKYGTVAMLKTGLKSRSMLVFQERNIPKEWETVSGPTAAMFYTVVCCLSAALVETRRRRRTMMSMFWLIPQFYFLIIVDVNLEETVKIFFKVSAAPSMKKYAVHLTQLVWGIGQALSLVWVLACKKWFNNDVDQSRLDKYHWTLTALSALTFICYFVLVILKIYKKQYANLRKSNKLVEGNSGNISLVCMKLQTGNINCLCLYRGEQ